ncbi:MAG: segregation and condensation protein A [Gammaproteobacteria bacterium]
MSGLRVLNMDKSESTTEEKILRIMKRVLTDVARDTHIKPGLKHPLSENTIIGIRDCLALISARESELASEAGRELKLRPHFVDEPKTSVVVQLDSTLKSTKKKDNE